MVLAIRAHVLFFISARKFFFAFRVFFVAFHFYPWWNVIVDTE